MTNNKQIQKIEWKVNGVCCYAVYTQSDRQFNGKPHYSVFANTKETIEKGKLVKSFEFKQHVGVSELEATLVKLPDATYTY